MTCCGLPSAAHDEEMPAPLVIADDKSRSRARELTRRLSSVSRPVIVTRDSFLVNRGLQWTDSRKLLEVVLDDEQKHSRATKDLEHLTHEQRLQTRLDRLQLDVQIARGDGNCQFRSVSQQMYGTEDYHASVRHTAVEHIRSHRDQYECYLGEDFDSYVLGMSRSGTWGDELTLRAICDAYGLHVNVVTSDESNWFMRYEPEQLLVDKEVFLTYIAPIHYNSLRRRNSLHQLSKALARSLSRNQTTASARAVTVDAILEGVEGEEEDDVNSGVVGLSQETNAQSPRQLPDLL